MISSVTENLFASRLTKSRLSKYWAALLGGKELYVTNVKAAGAELRNGAMEKNCLNFFVCSAVYGFEIQYVLQITGKQDINEILEAPPFMKDFVNLRGGVIPAAAAVSLLFKTD